VNVWVEIGKVPGGMYGHHRAGHAVWARSLMGVFDGFPCRFEQQSIPLAIITKENTEPFGNTEDHVVMRHVKQDIRDVCGKILSS
jgi:hypothetical protein